MIDDTKYDIGISSEAVPDCMDGVPVIRDGVRPVVVERRDDRVRRGVRRRRQVEPLLFDDDPNVWDVRPHGLVRHGLDGRRGERVASTPLELDDDALDVDAMVSDVVTSAARELDADVEEAGDSTEVAEADVTVVDDVSAAETVPLSDVPFAGGDDEPLRVYDGLFVDPTLPSPPPVEDAYVGRVEDDGRHRLDLRGLFMRTVVFGTVGLVVFAAGLRIYNMAMGTSPDDRPPAASAAAQVPSPSVGSAETGTSKNEVPVAASADGASLACSVVDASAIRAGDDKVRVTVKCTYVNAARDAACSSGLLPVLVHGSERAVLDDSSFVIHPRTSRTVTYVGDFSVDSTDLLFEVPEGVTCTGLDDVLSRANSAFGDVRDVVLADLETKAAASARSGDSATSSSSDASTSSDPSPSPSSSTYSSTSSPSSSPSSSSSSPSSSSSSSGSSDQSSDTSTPSYERDAYVPSPEYVSEPSEETSPAEPSSSSGYDTGSSDAVIADGGDGGGGLGN